MDEGNADWPRVETNSSPVDRLPQPGQPLGVANGSLLILQEGKAGHDRTGAE